MIDEEKLTILEVQGMVNGFHKDSDFKDLIRLARLGLWAEKQARPALEDIQHMLYGNEVRPIYAEQKAAKALSAYPKEPEPFIDDDEAQITEAKGSDRRTN